MTSLVLGFGSERGVRSEAVLSGITTVMESTNYAMNDVELIASIDVKDDEEGLLEAADELGIDLRFYEAEQLRQVDPPNPNPVVERTVGAPGVAESAALVASGNSSLLEEKTILRPDERAMTLALAERNETAS